MEQEKINDLDKTLAKLAKRKWEKTQINKIKGERRHTKTNTMKFKGSLGNISKPYILINQEI
jgi:hypothetical protein